jgi:hypothetical protein
MTDPAGFPLVHLGHGDRVVLTLRHNKRIGMTFLAGQFLVRDMNIMAENNIFRLFGFEYNVSPSNCSKADTDP